MSLLTVSLKNLEELPTALQRMRIPSSFHVVEPEMVCLIRRQPGGLLSVSLESQMIVQTGGQVPWRISYNEHHFWNFSNYGALQGSLELNGGNFTKQIHPNGMLDPPLSQIIRDDSGRYAIQDVSLNGRELTYKRILFPEKPNRQMLLDFLIHLGFTGRSRTLFPKGETAYRVLSYRHY